MFYNCNLNHIASDRSCAECSTQKDIKRIMAVENKFFAEAAQVKRLGIVHKGHTFADVANPHKGVLTNSFTVKEASSTSPQSSFQPLFNSQPKRKKRKKLISVNTYFLNIPFLSSHRIFQQSHQTAVISISLTNQYRTLLIPTLSILFLNKLPLHYFSHLIPY